MRSSPGASDDGVTVEIPVAALNQVDEADFTWPVPGLREELVTALLRSLPKALRVKVVPAPNQAKAFLAATTPGEEPLLDALERYLRRTLGLHVERTDWDLDKVPPHLRLGYRITADDGAVVGEGKDLEQLKGALAIDAGRAVASAASAIERGGLTTWDFETLPQTFTQTRAGHEVRGYPALVDEGATVAIRVLTNERDQQLVDALRHPPAADLRHCPRRRAAVLAGAGQRRQARARARAGHDRRCTCCEDCSCGSDRRDRRSGRWTGLGPRVVRATPRARSRAEAADS